MKTIPNWLNPRGIDLPLSEARTGWELCEELKVVIREEWRRIAMNRIQTRVAPDRKKAPACGIVGCLGGWSLTLRRIDFYTTHELFYSQVYKLLGKLNYDCVGPTHQNVFNGGEGDECYTTNPGTRAHARAVIKRLDRFMRLNEQALKARILPPLGQLTGGGTIVPDTVEAAR